MTWEKPAALYGRVARPRLMRRLLIRPPEDLCPVLAVSRSYLGKNRNTATRGEFFDLLGKTRCTLPKNPVALTSDQKTTLATVTRINNPRKRREAPTFRYGRSYEPQLKHIASSRQKTGTMPNKLIRRTTFTVLIACVFISLSSSVARAPAAVTVSTDQLFKQLESEYGVRLGVWALDTGTNRAVAWRAEERFAYASTHKVLACASVLQEDSVSQLNKVVTYTNADLVNYSPITKQYVNTGMKISAICDAAIRYSDNTAENLLFRQLGGPDGLNASLHRLGDNTTHADRIEPELNDAVPGDVRDTSTPRALGTDLMKFTVGNALPPDKRALLNEWLQGNTTGATLIRAEIPAGWRVGDKTGTGQGSVMFDI